jgi:HEAT repeat protein
MTMKTPSLLALAAALTIAGSIAHSAFAAENQSSADKQRELIQLLQSDAPKADKAIACKKLAIYGQKEAVPALAPLLLDPQLTSWARTALEAITDPAADDALRDALTKTDGRVLIGIVNSIGVRQDAQAVGALTQKLQDPDAGVASAAAEALGRIGNDAATQALEQALNTERLDVRSSVAYGCILCAEKAMAGGKSEQAIKLYDRLRQANLPKQRILEATRGAILARGADGLPLLLEQLNSGDLALFSIGLRAARELPGRQVTEALASELDRSSLDRQGPILLAISDRTDEAVLPKLLQVGETGAPQVRKLALGLFDRFRDPACVPVLLKAATEDDPELAQTAQSALARLGGKEIDADLLARLRLASGKERQVLIELASRRRIAAALPVIMRSTEDSNTGVRRAAVEAAGVLGSDAEASQLVGLLSPGQSLEDREQIESALTAICARAGTRCLPQVLPLVRGNDSSLRVVGLHTLAAIGGPDALSAVRGALKASDTAVQGEAVRTLASWPNTWPDDSSVVEPLLALAKSDASASHRTQALQGYLNYLQETKKLNSQEKLDQFSQVQPLIQSPDEKRLGIAVLSTIGNAGALERLVDFADDKSVSEEACLAIVKIATDRNQRDASKELRRKALQVVLDKSESDATKKKASDGLRRLQ